MRRCVLILSLFSAYSSFCQHELPTDVAQINQLLSLSKKDQWTDPYRSLSYADQALQQAQDINYIEGIAEAENLKGFCFWSLGDNELAIQAARKALDLATTENNALQQADSYYILARGYMDLSENRKAKEYIIQAEKFAMAGKDWTQLCSIYNLKGVILFIENKLDSALYFYNRAYEAGKTHGVNPIHLARILSNIGECYQEDNPALALQYYNEGLLLAQKTQNKITEASITSIIGHAHLRGKDIRNAELKLQEALQLARALGLRRVIRHAYAGLVEIKLMQGNGQQAVTYLRRYYTVNDSLLNTAKIRQIVELEASYELQLKEQNIKLLESERKVQTLWRNVMIGMVILVILLATGLIILQRYRYRRNREMLNLEIDYLTQQHLEAINRYKALQHPVAEDAIESLEQKFLRQAVAFVETNMADTKWSVEKMAEALHMSRTSLHRKIKSITGFPPSELIRTIRLRKAARLIASRSDSPTQVALLVGFEDYSHFSKAFKKHFGVSPSGYEERVNAGGAIPSTSP